MSALMNVVRWFQDIAKTDDDVFVNIGLLVKQVPLLNFTGVIHHKLPKASGPQQYARLIRYADGVSAAHASRASSLTKLMANPRRLLIYSLSRSSGRQYFEDTIFPE